MSTVIKIERVSYSSPCVKASFSVVELLVALLSYMLGGKCPWRQSVPIILFISALLLV